MLKIFLLCEIALVEITFYFIAKFTSEFTACYLFGGEGGEKGVSLLNEELYSHESITLNI